jgi:hypothetical protein
MRCPDDRARRSFAAYYYTREAPPGWDGSTHSTLFRSRPNEKIKGHGLMPLEQAGRRMRQAARNVKRPVKSRLKNQP